MNQMNWLAIAPEVVLLVMALVVAMVDLWVKHPRRTPTYLLAQASLAVVAAMHLLRFDAGETFYAVQRMVVADPMGHLLAFFAALATMVSLAYARPYAAEREMLKGELITLAMLSLLGISVMVSANNFLVVYLGLELMSLSLYALVALRRDHAPATEAAMKYFVLGALASGFLLYGMSMMYGATGSLDIGEVFKAIASGRINQAVLVLGIVFIVAGLAFKLGAVPFHMWIPDVYQGAPTAVTLLIAGAPKLAAFAITIRLLVEGMSGLAQDWQQMLIVLSVASMALGNIAAIAQSNLKRMLAYSTIGQIGFMLLGLTPTVVSVNTLSAANGYSSSMFYVLSYVFTTLGTFGIVMLLARAGHEAEQVDDLKGLAKRSPWYAAVMAIFMFSLAGIPPTVGFYAKLAVLQAIVSTNVSLYIWLAIVAVLLSLVAAFYYLRVIKVMYFDEPVDAHPIASTGEVRTILSLNGAAILLFGILPGGLMAMCAQAIVKALSS
ncbi:MAG TPA: NADH-quinone oxidoreductase subunit NuoN [Piscinibacter sp.]|uniref:NADH-quinone oxidoreductase subunit NuoN n=1 Tax=Piscinibacter sp. TaxID=1903157 RepID=UPI0011D50622|nr:NADH-quinone oxidoreductase subunit NuoN [Piscinibacter sp.]MBP5989248.1 NADH-quinone oxidoreductase subunit NuoN [Piscinibacter sp.]MBP6026832.1 NADH-quinone oxidoreductase subunit NuoN [Piscinibacter sp.]TXH57993.1 MAG: NADH-quinone oxidoreductase subunit NuoN [Burkholderiaceae bacterium]HNK17452.1 NADH-quinone oxidoreductase subunit NuoN [Piscinibacter sp.]